MTQRYLWVLALTASVLCPARASDLPGWPGWKNEDIGGPDPGSTVVQGTGPSAKWTVTGHGADIWGTADQFQFAYTTLPGDGGITARLLAQEGGHDDGWAKTGTMLRESTDPGSRMAMMPYNNGPAYKFQPGYRLVADTQPTDLGLGSTTGRRLENGGPIYIRTQRHGQVYQNLLSDDGKSWRLITSVTMEIPANTPILAGLCACAHGGDKPVVVTFDSVSVTADVVTPAPAGPGAVQASPGSGAVLLTFRTVPNALGYNIYRQGPDDKAPVRVNAESTTYSWFVDLGPDGKGLTSGVSYRYTVRALVKNAAGEVIESLDSQVVLAEPQAPIPPGFYSYDLGTQTPGSTRLENNVLTITASGRGIQDESDGIRFVAIPIFADATVNAKILEKPAAGAGNTAPVKAGVMLRESLDPGSPSGAVLATTDKGVIFQWRRGFRMTVNDRLNDDPGIGSAQGTSVDDTKYPQFLRIARVGQNISGFQSGDGTNYTPIGDAVSFPILTLPTYAGLAVTAGSEGKEGTAKFDAASVSVK
jgi:hypothetical protein